MVRVGFDAMEKVIVGIVEQDFSKLTLSPSSLRSLSRVYSRRTELEFAN